MIKHIYLTLILFLCLGASLSGCDWRDYTKSINFNEATVKIGDATYNVSIAETIDQVTKGLQGFKSLPDKSGMLFKFPIREYRTFWNKGVKMAIDLLWIRDGTIIGVVKNIPPVDLETDLQKIPLYTSPEPIDQVIEVPAGTVDSEEWEVGDQVSDLDYPLTSAD